jgi:hypothetical protein
MRAFLLAALLIASAALLSGCASRPAAPQEPDGQKVHKANADAMAAAPGAASAANASKSPPSSISIAEKGNLPPCAGAPSQPMPPCTLLGGKRWFRHDAPHRKVTGADLTLTWTATNPTMANLKFAFSPIAETSSGEQFTGDSRIVEGPSPLRLNLSGLGWTEGLYTIAVWWSGDVVASPQQDFQIDGSIAAT